MKLPFVLHNILNERYNTATLEKKKQEVNPLNARNPFSNEIKRGGADPDIQRGQFPISDPELGPSYSTKEEEEEDHFRPVWVPPPPSQARARLVPPNEPPPSLPKPQKPPLSPESRSNFKNRFSNVSPLPRRELERVVGRGPENPDVLKRIGPRGGFIGPVLDSEFFDAINPDGTVTRLIRPRPGPGKELVGTFKTVGKTLPGAIIGSELADYAVDEYGLPLLPRGWEEENLTGWWEPSSRTAYEMIGADLVGSLGYGAIQGAGALGGGAALGTATGIGTKAATGMLTSPVGIAITALPAIYTSAKYLMTPEADEINSALRYIDRAAEEEKIKRAREFARQKFIDDLYKRQQEYKESQKNK
jgi:hypothetical protein